MTRSMEIGINYCVEHASSCRRKDVIAQIGIDLLAAAYYAGGFKLTGSGASK